jgi:hypothetical protein
MFGMDRALRVPASWSWALHPGNTIHTMAIVAPSHPCIDCYGPFHATPPSIRSLLFGEKYRYLLPLACSPILFMLLVSSSSHSGDCHHSHHFLSVASLSCSVYLFLHALLPAPKTNNTILCQKLLNRYRIWEPCGTIFNMLLLFFKYYLHKQY